MALELPAGPSGLMQDGYQQHQASSKGSDITRRLLPALSDWSPLASCHRVISLLFYENSDRPLSCFQGNFAAE